jgi:diguanylate cyclase (GGDEF)-like protein
MAEMALALHPAALETAGVVVSLAVGAGSAAGALRQRAAARAAGIALRRERERQATFAGAALRLTAAARDSVGAVRAEIAAAVRACVPAADGALIYDERDGALCCAAAFGERFAYYAGTAVALDDPTALAACALRAGHRVALGAGNRAAHPADVAACAFPLSHESGRRSILVVAAQRALHDDDLDRLAALTEHAAPAYSIALDREQDRHDAEYDGLTGLLTPRAFRRSLSALIDAARFAPATCLALLFIDTDHFKRWNDRFGHAAGDVLLRELANVLRTAVACGDLVGRNGGDEFCVVFTETDKSTAIERAEKLRRRIAALDVRTPLPSRTPGAVPITASIGVASYPADASSARDLLERADAAMYHSKAAGRNGVSYCTDHGFARLPPCEPA